MPDLPAVGIPRSKGPQTRKSQRRGTLRNAEVRRPPLQRLPAQRQLVVESQFFADIPCEAGLQFLKGEAAIPTDTRLIVDVGRKDVGFRETDVLVPSATFVTSVTSARTKEGKQVAHEVVVEIENITAIKRVPIGDPIIEPGSDLIGVNPGRIERPLEVIHQVGSSWQRDQLENFQRCGMNKTPQVRGIIKYPIAVAF